MTSENIAKNAILERIPKWLASVALLIFVLLLVISYMTGKRISWSPLGFVSDIAEMKSVIPKGAVVAFADHKTGDQERDCSKLGEGWEKFEAANGKFILGAGNNLGRSFAAGSYGGEYEVVLGLNQMPKHSHTYLKQTDTGGGCGLSGCGFHSEYPQTNTSSAGGNDSGETIPHNNMPPYIVLTYCKKV